MEESKAMLKASWKMMLVVVMTIVCMTIASQKADAASGVQINATNFPDNGLRREVSEQIDKNRDGVLNTAEINAVTKLDFGPWNQISNLKGLERFVNLKDLTMRVNLWNVDLRKLTKLTSLNIDYSAYSGNITVKVKYLANLNASRMQNVKGIILDGDIRKADVSNCPNLINITTKNTTNLSLLDASNCNLDYYNNGQYMAAVPGNMNINIIGKGVKKVVVSYSGYKTIKVSGKIVDLYCDRMQKLETINANHSNIRMIFAKYSRNLKKITAQYGTMDYFDVEAYGCSKIESVDASYCRNLKTLHVHAGNTPLKTVIAEYCNKASDYASQAGTINTINIESPALKNVWLRYSTAKTVYETIEGNGTTVVNQAYNRSTEKLYLAGSEKVKTFDARYNHKNIKAYNLPQGAKFLK